MYSYPGARVELYGSRYRYRYLYLTPNFGSTKFIIIIRVLIGDTVMSKQLFLFCFCCFVFLKNPIRSDPILIQHPDACVSLFLSSY